MYKKLDLLWQKMIQDMEHVNKQHKNIVIRKDKYLDFKNEFERMYNDVKNIYMNNSVEFLDRHKVSAIIMCSIINTKIVEDSIKVSDKEFVTNYQLAISAGLSYMLYELNHQLITQNKKTMNKFLFPQVMYGKLSYKENLMRMLYFSDKDNNMNILSIANLLFLLENYNIIVQTRQ